MFKTLDDNSCCHRGDVGVLGNFCVTYKELIDNKFILMSEIYDYFLKVFFFIY